MTNPDDVIAPDDPEPGDVEVPDLPTVKLIDGYRRNRLRVIPDRLGGARLEISSISNDDEDTHHMSVDLDDEQFVELYTKIVAPLAAYHAEAEATAERYSQRRGAEDQQQEARKPFVLKQVPNGLHGLHATVHTATCATVTGLAVRRSDLSAVSEALTKFMVNAKSSLTVGAIDHRARRHAAGKRVTVLKPTKFCGRCNPLGDDTDRINTALKQALDATADDAARFERLEQLDAEIRELLRQATHRHLTLIGDAQ